MPDEAQAVHEGEPSNATPEPVAEAKHDTVRSKIKALLEDAKKASNEIITNTRVLVGVTMELEKLVPKAHTSLTKVRTIAVQTTTDALFAETTVKEYQTEHQEESVAPATRIVIRELDVDVPLRDVQEASYVGKGKVIIEEVSRRPRTRSIQCSTMQVPTEPQGDSVAPAPGIVIRELDANVPM
ncbi:hypothetical protein Cgig2_009772 [Carnegiea gigantea]|uniref:Uncharacterized protein n=1 Tax=Carnegiea gigantea TaxID=171969 RepID=A0A9Q1JH65_9CARY|nr:hypothetical protein Cgig2_009772 [Carnegiea gigantea]